MSNPTPTPTVNEDPGGMDIDQSGNVIPDAVNALQTTGITKPAIAATDYSSTTSSLNYQTVTKSSNIRASAFFGQTADNLSSTPTRANLFVNFCPAKNSFVKGSASLAYAVGGSGFYGGNGAYWSTNFIDPGSSSCAMLKGTGTSWGGLPYYSKNTVTGSGNAQYMLTGACTIEGTSVKLVWAVNWGVVTMNSMFDTANGDGTYSVYAFSIPYNSDGTVNVSALNTSVMVNCPARGAFVMLDLVTRSFVYTFMDGESLQYAVQSPAGLAAGKVAGAVSLRSEPASDDQTLLPLASALPALPVFAGGAVSGSGTSPSWSANTTALNQQRSAPWYSWVTGYADKNATGVSINPSADLGTQTANSATMMVKFNGTNYYGLASMPAIQVASGSTLYSGYIISGSATQCVGSIISGLLFVTPYGYKSFAPAAQSGGSFSYTLTTTNTQAEIIANVQLPSGFVGGFTYDASVGAYGTVSWVSQI